MDHLCSVSVLICNHLDMGRGPGLHFLESRSKARCCAAVQPVTVTVSFCVVKRFPWSLPSLSPFLRLSTSSHLTCHGFRVRFFNSLSCLSCFNLPMFSHMRGCGRPGFVSVLVGPFYLSNTRPYVCPKCVRNSARLPCSAVSCLEPSPSRLLIAF